MLNFLLGLWKSLRNFDIEIGFRVPIIYSFYVVSCLTLSQTRPHPSSKKTVTERTWIGGYVGYGCGGCLLEK